MRCESSILVELVVLALTKLGLVSSHISLAQNSSQGRANPGYRSSQVLRGLCQTTRSYSDEPTTLYRAAAY
jgi:hypothetical protein